MSRLDENYLNSIRDRFIERTYKLDPKSKCATANNEADKQCKIKQKDNRFNIRKNEEVTSFSKITKPLFKAKHKLTKGKKQIKKIVIDHDSNGSFIEVKGGIKQSSKVKVKNVELPKKSHTLEVNKQPTLKLTDKYNDVHIGKEILNKKWKIPIASNSEVSGTQDNYTKVAQNTQSVCPKEIGMFLSDNNTKNNLTSKTNLQSPRVGTKKLISKTKMQKRHLSTSSSNEFDIDLKDNAISSGIEVKSKNFEKEKNKLKGKKPGKKFKSLASYNSLDDFQISLEPTARPDRSDYIFKNGNLKAVVTKKTKKKLKISPPCMVSHLFNNSYKNLKNNLPKSEEVTVEDFKGLKENDEHLYGLLRDLPKKKQINFTKNKNNLKTDSFEDVNSRDKKIISKHETDQRFTNVSVFQNINKTSEKKRIKKKEESTFFENNLNCKKCTSSLSSLSKILDGKDFVEKRVHYSVGLNNTTDLSEIYDDEKVGVKGLKYKKFCNIFYKESTPNLKPRLKIPERHFTVREGDIFTEKPLEKSEKIMGDTSNIALVSEQSENLPLKVTLEDTNSLNDIKNNFDAKKSNNINILDIKILKSDQFSNSNEQNSFEMNDSQNNLSTMSSPDIGNCNLENQPNENLNVESPEQYREEISFVAQNDSVQDSVQDLEKINEDKTKSVVILLNDGNLLLALFSDQKLYIHGYCILNILHGEVDLYGATLTKDSVPKKVFSPRGTALLYLKNKNSLNIENTEENAVELKNFIFEDLLPEEYKNVLYMQSCAIILCKELKESYIDFVETHISQKLFPDFTSYNPRLNLQLKGEWNKLQFHNNIHEAGNIIINNNKRNFCVVVSGGKGVGKSTFVRWIVNQLLQKFSQVRVLDLDPGQAEFTPPGLISSVTIKDQIFGPSYTHLLKPERSYLAHINVGHDIKKYVLSVKELTDFVKTLKPLPTIVNLPGFTQGLGLDITINTIKLVQPDFVIQINSKSHSKNYRITLSDNEVEKYATKNKILCNHMTRKCDKLRYEHINVESNAINNKAWTLEARQSRELNIVAYFGSMMSGDIKELTNEKITMYSINISALHITNMDATTISPLAVNANIVALCSRNRNSNFKDSEIFQCYGYGFVRGIDIQSDTLVLLTPEPIETLDLVTHLVLGSVTIPPSLIMTADRVKEYVPYVNVGELVNFGQFTKRSYIPSRK